MAAAGKNVYACLVEGCGLHFNSEPERWAHVASVHKFPVSLRYRLTKSRINTSYRGRTTNSVASKGREKKKYNTYRSIGDQQRAKENSKPVSNSTEMDIDSLTESISRLATNEVSACTKCILVCARMFISYHIHSCEISNGDLACAMRRGTFQPISASAEGAVGVAVREEDAVEEEPANITIHTQIMDKRRRKCVAVYQIVTAWT